MVNSLWGLATDVGSFWASKGRDWWNGKPLRDQLLERLANATTFEEWEQIAFSLDALLSYDLWRENPASTRYDYKLIHERIKFLVGAQEADNLYDVVNSLRSGLLRNIGNITTPKLFNRAYGGTKCLISEYIAHCSQAIEYVVDVPTSQDIESWWTPQAKLDLFHDTRQAYGRTSLLLQGGAIFGLSHLGVVKALYLRGLLPRIITGNATGALIAALVCIHTDDELLEFLSGDGIDLSAFDQNLKRKPTEDDESDLANKQFIPEYPAQLLDTLTRRIMRYVREGYFLDIEILADCAHTNLGEITFEEAYKRTKRILNITISTSGEAGVPTVLNYLTAPNVCIWSAALASNSSSSLYSPVIIYSKDENGNTVPWPTTENVTFNPNRQTKPASERESPLARIAELFNVNHFIVSQARPYIAPFLQSELHHPNPRFSDGAAALFAPCFRLMTSELHHRLKQLDTLGVLPASLGSLLLEETIPAASITLVPDITISDFAKLLENPTKENLEYWMLRGERAVWPAIDAITVRCGVEVKLDKCYHRVRLAKPLDGDSASVRKVGSKGSLAVLRLRSMGSWEGPSTRNHHQNGASGNRSSTNEQDEDDVTTVYDDEG